MLLKISSNIIKIVNYYNTFLYVIIVTSEIKIRNDVTWPNWISLYILF